VTNAEKEERSSGIPSTSYAARCLQQEPASKRPRLSTALLLAAKNPCAPRTNGTVSLLVSVGHSPYVSWLLPQRGSRTRLMLGPYSVIPAPFSPAVFGLQSLEATPPAVVLDVLDEAQQLGNPLELAPLLRKLQDFLELLHHTARQELQEALKDEAGTDVMELALFRYEGFEADDIQFLHRKVADKRDAAV